VNEFGVPANDEGLDYLRRIAATMTRLFSLEPEEAVGRIAEFWGSSVRDRARIGRRSAPGYRVLG
jgi:hypothetical protein